MFKLVVSNSILLSGVTVNKDATAMQTKWVFSCFYSMRVQSHHRYSHWFFLPETLTIFYKAAQDESPCNFIE